MTDLEEIPVIVMDRLGSPRRCPQEYDAVRCTEIHVKTQLTGELKYILRPAAIDHVVETNLVHTETLRTISDLLPAPPPSIRLAWKSIGAGRFEVTFLLTTVTTFVEHKGDYDETRDPTSIDWRKHGPLARCGRYRCALCGTIPKPRPIRQCTNIDCFVEALDDNICQNCIREINGENWCIECLMTKEDGWTSITKPPARPYPEDTERWLSLFQKDTRPFEEIVSRR